MIKKYLLVFGLLFFGIGISNGAQVFIEPNFADPRFEPADRLHAECLHTATVSIKTSAKENLSSFRFIISYEPQFLEILNIQPSEAYKSILDSKIESETMIVSLVNKTIPSGEKTNLFTISFKSTEYTSGTILAIRKPSYLVDQNNKEIPIFVEQKLAFTKVPECEPDVVAPSIKLVRPQSTGSLLGLDSYFVFSLKDQGKGINKESVIVRFDGKTYTGANSAFVREKDKLTFYPDKWISVGTAVNLSVAIGDKQNYGGANKSKQTWSFMSSSGIVFDNEITPTMYRTIANKSKALYPTTQECQVLTTLANQSSTLQLPFEQIEALSAKINCSFDKESVIKTLQINKQKAKSTIFISVFSVLGWILFAITFVLKLHYFVSYKKQKRINKEQN